MPLRDSAARRRPALVIKEDRRRYLLTDSLVRRRQTLERKAAFIHQVAGRDFDEREAEDIGEHVLSFAEVKALATGDARIMEKATVDTDVARLVRLKRLWHEDQRRLRYVLDKARQQAETSTAAADRFAAVFERVTDTRGDKFEMVIGGRREAKRATAGERLHEVLTARLQATPPETTTEPEPVAYLAGLDVLGQTTTAIESEVRLLVPEAQIEMRFVQHEWASLDATQLVQRLERRIQRLPETIERLRNDATAATEEAQRAEVRLGEPWEHADELSRLQRRQQELNEALNADSPADEPSADLIDHALHDALSTAGFGSSNDAVSRLRQRLDHPRSPSVSDGLSL